MEHTAMLRSFLLLALLAIAPSVAAGDQRAIIFGGERYVRAFKDTKSNGQMLVEFVRAGEALESWKKLVTLHRFPAAKPDPKPMVGSLVNVLKQRYPDARYKISENPKTGEVMIDFLASAQGSETVEFNVFKYARHESGQGLIAIQFAQRFMLGEVAGEEVRKVREAAVAEAATFKTDGLDPLLRD
jgi:hypothetical protein